MQRFSARLSFRSPASASQSGASVATILAQGSRICYSRALASSSGTNEKTLRGYLRKANPNAPTLRQAEAIADACGVPATFMQVGFAPLEQPITDLERRVYEIENRVAKAEKAERFGRKANIKSRGSARAVPLRRVGPKDQPKDRSKDPPAQGDQSAS
jgi:hypothetical protein